MQAENRCDRQERAVGASPSKYAEFFSVSPGESDSDNINYIPTTLGKNRCWLRDDPGHDSSRRIQMFKICILILIPCIGLAVSTIITLLADATEYRKTTELSNEIIASIKLGNLIHYLQIERGQTVLLVSSKYDKIVFVNVVKRRLETNNAIKEVDPWPINDSTSSYLSNSTSLRNYLDAHRDSVVDMANTTIDSELKFYSDVNREILNWISRRLRNARTEILWNNLVSYQLFLSGKEETGIERALGGVYFSQSQLSHLQILHYYSRLQRGQMSINSSRQYSTYLDNLYKVYVLNASVYDQLQMLRKDIIANTYHQPSVTYASYWFENITMYIDQLKTIQDLTAYYIQAASIRIGNAAYVNFVMSLILLIVVAIVCPLLIYFISKLLNHIQSYAINLADKTRKLERERRKTDNLLCEMLPRSVADQLKRGNHVIAESYDNVTLYFSDIVGFTNICHHSTALEVVNMLNYIYINFDSQIEKYNVYKVETIGDAYMVVSGVPSRLSGNRHAAEIANMAIDLLDVMKDLRAPHKPEIKIQLRSGIHSGSVAAGVVGRKMPRYCLFGDAVNVASRMESLGDASKIHCSESTYNILSNHGIYDFQPRGEMNVKGLGVMRTFWLIGKIITFNTVIS
ncbi:Atrial natriuretic peptide receptor 2 [Trichoplax sp. H2]|nr:Atrial natriuretic peptide receptor 2 [Trichoplax sp. H2]|eukprot:RDD39001.1 Atrial natriuretic peptide receptor 2 [Trichoplax sp. H2]